MTTQEQKSKIGRLYRDAIIQQLNKQYQSRPSLVAVNFNKVNSFDLSQLRQSLLDTDAKLIVTKNSLFKRFLSSINKKDFFGQPLGLGGLVFVGKDVVSPVKVLAGFIKEHEGFKFLGAFLDDRELSASALQEIGKLPSLQDLRAKAVMTMKSPLFRLRAVLAQSMVKLVLCIKAAQEAKQKQSPKEG